jgi:hypothetical protein
MKTNIIKINQRHDYKDSKTYFLLLPNYVWMYILIFGGEPYTGIFRFTPKYKKLLADKTKLESMYTSKEIKKILNFLSKAAETTVDTVTMQSDKIDPFNQLQENGRQ